MEEKTFENDQAGLEALRFFSKWKKTLIAAFVIAFIGFTVVALLLTPKFKSVAVIFPANSNRVSKAILADRYSMDFMDYGSERDCEYAIQVLSSSTMMEAVRDHFDLMTHYEINPQEVGAQYKLEKAYSKSVKVTRTEFMAVEISVLDKDPQMAADIANFIACYYDSICRDIQLGRSADAYSIMSGVCDELQQTINSLNDSIKAHPDRQSLYHQLIDANCKELAGIQARTAQTKVDMDENIHYKFWLSKAVPADKKFSPKRSLVIAIGTCSTWIFFLVVLMATQKISSLKRKGLRD